MVDEARSNPVVRDAFGFAHQGTELPKINYTLFEEIVHWIKNPVVSDNELAWYQGEWITENLTGEDLVVPEGNMDVVNYNTPVEKEWCGTACCVAGYAVISQLGVDKALRFSDDTKIVDSQGEVKSYLSYECAGRQILGLTIGESKILFEANNDKDIVLGALQTIAASRGYSLEI